MSAEAIDFVLGLDVKSTPQKLLLMILAHHMPENTGACVVTQEQVSREMGSGVQQVRTHMRALRRDGRIGMSAVYNAAGSRHASRYTFYGYNPQAKYSTESKEKQGVTV